MNVTVSYRPIESPIHRLSPFVMLGWVAAVLFASMLLQHPLWLAGAFLATVAVAWKARIIREWAALMRYVTFMAVAIVAINALVSQQGSHVLLEAGFRLPLVGTPRLTVEALVFGGAMALRLSAIISAFTLLNLCVHPDDLMRAAIKLKLPYRSVLVTSLSTRFIPVLMADARTVVDVQRSRGLSFDRGNVVERIRNAGALIFPLLSNSLDRAVQVAEAMEARAYGARVHRTFYRDRSLRPGEVVLLVLLAAGGVLLVVAHVTGVGGYQYYPALDGMKMTLGEWVALWVFLATLLSVVMPKSSRFGEER